MSWPTCAHCGQPIPMQPQPADAVQHTGVHAHRLEFCNDAHLNLWRVAHGLNPYKVKAT